MPYRTGVMLCIAILNLLIYCLAICQYHLPYQANYVNIPRLSDNLPNHNRLCLHNKETLHTSYGRDDVNSDSSHS